VLNDLEKGALCTWPLAQIEFGVEEELQIFWYGGNEVRMRVFEVRMQVFEVRMRGFVADDGM
jgi:hypothetical protein